MAKLPFIVAPRLSPIIETIGSKESGQIEIKRMGYLTAAEKAFTQSQSTDSDSTRSLLALSRAIGASLKLDLQKSYEVLAEVMQGIYRNKTAEKIRSEYETEIDSLLSAMAGDAERKRLVCALAMIVYRVNAEFEAADLIELHPDLIDGLVALYEDEESRTVERLAESLDDEPMTSADQIDSLEKK